MESVYQELLLMKDFNFPMAMCASYKLQWSTGIAAHQQVQGGPVYIFVVDRRDNSVQSVE